MDNRCLYKLTALYNEITKKPRNIYPLTRNNGINLEFINENSYLTCEILENNTINVIENDISCNNLTLCQAIKRIENFDNYSLILKDYYTLLYNTYEIIMIHKDNKLLDLIITKAPIEIIESFNNIKGSIMKNLKRINYQKKQTTMIFNEDGDYYYER